MWIPFIRRGHKKVLRAAIMQKIDFSGGFNTAYFDQLYKQFLENPESLGAEWVAFFQGFELGNDSQSPGQTLPPPGPTVNVSDQVQLLVHSYQELGHLLADLNPLNAPLSHGNEYQPLLELSQFGLAEKAASEIVGAGGFEGPTDGSLGDLVTQLRNTYCRTFAVEFVNIPDKTKREWLQKRMEPFLNRPALTVETARHTLRDLIFASAFEQYLQVKYVGQKRFSLEGAEALIPLLSNLVDDGSQLGAQEFVFGMAHRGRLNVLANTLKKPYAMIFSEFEGTSMPQDNEGGDGDVKYHLGYSNDLVTPSGNKVHLSLAPNPSHLELVNPVVEGLVHCKQETRGDEKRERIIPVLIHGEAAFTGQGSVTETLTLTLLKGYKTGGTIHIIINNQVGFTADSDETRFTRYPSDVGKLIPAPIFHVNGDDPEAVIHASRLAIEYRQAFKTDVLIDLWCYRRHGHNEADDPTYTQPLMYDAIAKHAIPGDIFAKSVIERGLLTESDVAQIRKEAKDALDSAFLEDRSLRRGNSAFNGVWKGFTRGPKPGGSEVGEPTKISSQVIEKITTETGSVPEGFNIHPKLKKFLEGRREMAFDGKNADWGMAETWAFGSLILEGHSVRLAGQDSGRGTFSHRHAVFNDYRNGQIYVPLDHLSQRKGSFTVINTMLSELAVLGFEFGYSMADPNNLVLWEAQFGDFVNGAQPIIDQFISSSESKWNRMSGLVLLLPHGYEGQGPEHSSARVERFLQSCADRNMQVCYPTEPSQYFHLLRRQVMRNFRKPLILMTPKSLLRNKLSTSPLENFTDGEFRHVIDDKEVTDSDRVERLIVCSGKVFFTLTVAREAMGVDNVAVVRVEQLYPFPEVQLERIFEKYRNARDVMWVQEEPRNMGGWRFFSDNLRDRLPTLKYCGRDEAASPATGWHRQHDAEEKKFVEEALTIAESVNKTSTGGKPRTTAKD
jgi:2-oxoglutarate dehydrogenase E1 component